MQYFLQKFPIGRITKNLQLFLCFLSKSDKSLSNGGESGKSVSNFDLSGARGDAFEKLFCKKFLELFKNFNHIWFSIRRFIKLHRVAPA